MRPMLLRHAGPALAALVLAGCGQPSADRLRAERMEGARRALAAIPDARIVASDASGGTLTVRLGDAGPLLHITVEGDAADITSRAQRESVAAAPATSNPVPAAAATSPATAGEVAATADAGTAANSAPPAGAAPAGAAPVTAAGSPESAAAPGSASAAAPNLATATVVRDRGGRIARIEGPGFSVERSAAPGGTDRGVAASAAALAGGATASAAAPARADGRRHLQQPLVCASGEQRTLEAADIDVSGAGVVAQRGCTLQLTNVVVHAGGWGMVIARGAIVRVDDSVIQGQTGAVDLEPGAVLSSWATTYRGMFSRPPSAAEYVDRGGNVRE